MLQVRGAGAELDTILDCHRRLSKILSPDSEPVQVLRRVEEHRRYWRPDRVKVVLLAESHVYTNSDELGRKIALPASAPPDLPRGFVRFVYCLGYGENRLLSRPIVTPPNTGTPQLWKIFRSCVSPPGQDADVAGLQSSAAVAARVANKLGVLQQLRERGVWLLDASIAALSSPNRPEPAPLLIETCLQVSWDHHVGRVVEAAAPTHIICIGRGVAKALGDRLTGLGSSLTVLPQPTARLSSAEQAESLRTYHRVVRDANGLA
jgi:hypothetical protein